MGRRYRQCHEEGLRRAGEITRRLNRLNSSHDDSIELAALVPKRCEKLRHLIGQNVAFIRNVNLQMICTWLLDNSTSIHLPFHTFSRPPARLQCCRKWC